MVLTLLIRIFYLIIFSYNIGGKKPFEKHFITKVVRIMISTKTNFNFFGKVVSIGSSGVGH